jgi:diguanylate cyclase (GGDEF)-like protein/PAS domain S-box-containing protein
MTPLTLAVALVAALAAVAAGGLAVVAWQRRRVPGVSWFAAAAAAVAVWCAAYAGELFAPSLAGKVTWARLTYLGLALLPSAWLLFCLRYTSTLRRRVLEVAAVLFVIPVVTIVFVTAGVNLSLVWASASLAVKGGLQSLVVEHGPWFWVSITHAYGCLAVGSVVLLRTVLRQVSPRQAEAVSMSVAFPWVVHALFASELLPTRRFDPTPVAVAAGGLFLALALARLERLDIFPGIVPVARDAVIDLMQDGVLVVDAHGRVLDANLAAKRLLGGCTDQLVKQSVDEILSPGLLQSRADARDGARLHEPGTSFETRVRDGDGSEHCLEVVASGLHTPGAVLVMRDVSERRRLEEELHHRALYDDLTGLPNRTLLREQLKEMLALRRRHADALALLIVDIDRFKEINDTLGHAEGDYVLRAVARKLRATMRESDIVTRLSGDEFAVILPACNAEKALLVASKIRQRLDMSVSLREQEICVSVTVGGAVSPDHGDDEATLQRHADVALYFAKSSHDGTALYDADRDPNSAERLAMLSELRAAVHGGKLALYFQPVTDVATGTLVRLESLARWPLEDGRVLPAGEFISLADRNGLLPKLTRWALEEALRQCRRWLDEGFAVDVAVNLSATDLRDPGLVEHVLRSLEETGVPPRHLWVEVTESSAMIDPERSRQVLEDLRAAGVCVSIDDFGVGQSSLAYVRELPASEIKIDKSFVRCVDTEPRDAAIVRAAVTLAHELGLSVTAEGVESGEALPCIADLGCDTAQGYHIGRPMPADDVRAWAAARAATLGSAPASAEALPVM